MYKKVLVPLDGSKRAESILPHVQALLEQNPALASGIAWVDRQPSARAP